MWSEFQNLFELPTMHTCFLVSLTKIYVGNMFGQRACLSPRERLPSSYDFPSISSQQQTNMTWYKVIIGPWTWTFFSKVNLTRSHIPKEACLVAVYCQTVPTFLYFPSCKKVTITWENAVKFQLGQFSRQKELSDWSSVKEPTLSCRKVPKYLADRDRKKCHVTWKPKKYFESGEWLLAYYIFLWSVQKVICSFFYFP